MPYCSCATKSRVHLQGALLAEQSGALLHGRHGTPWPWHPDTTPANAAGVQCTNQSCAEAAAWLPSTTCVHACRSDAAGLRLNILHSLHLQMRCPKQLHCIVLWCQVFMNEALCPLCPLCGLHPPTFLGGCLALAKPCIHLCCSWAAGWVLGQALANEHPVRLTDIFPRAQRFPAHRDEARYYSAGSGCASW